MRMGEVLVLESKESWEGLQTGERDRVGKTLFLFRTERSIAFLYSAELLNYILFVIFGEKHPFSYHSKIYMQYDQHWNQEAEISSAIGTLLLVIFLILFLKVSEGVGSVSLCSPGWLEMCCVDLVVCLSLLFCDRVSVFSLGWLCRPGWLWIQIFLPLLSKCWRLKACTMSCPTLCWDKRHMSLCLTFSEFLKQISVFE